MQNPTKTVIELLGKANAAMRDPSLVFITLLTAAVVAGKIIGMDQREIRRKIKEVDRPASEIHKQIMEKMQ